MAESNGQSGRWTAGSLREVGQFFGLTEEAIKRDWRKNSDMPGRPKRWPLDEIARWRLAYLTKGRPLIAADQLARFRMLRADLLELEKAERDRSLVRIDVIVSVLSRLATIIRQCGEQLERDFGSDACELLMDALDAYETELDLSGLCEPSDGGE